MTYYVIHKGKKRGIFNSWEECKPHIFGCRKPIFKKFDNLEDAQNFLICGFGTKINQSMENMGISISNPSLSQSILHTDSINSNNSHKIIENYNLIHLFTDGSLIRHSNTNISCGYGIYIPSFSISSQFNFNNFIENELIEFCEYQDFGNIVDNKTNNRAELKAIIVGLRHILSSLVSSGLSFKSQDKQIILNREILEKMHLINSNFTNINNKEYELNKPLIIKLYTDSKYSTLILDKTGEKYRKSGYIIKGEQVKNADMIDEILKIKDLLTVLNIQLKVLHIFSHTNLDTFESNGNKIADELANKGARFFNKTSNLSDSRYTINGRKGMSIHNNHTQIIDNSNILLIPTSNNINQIDEKKINPFFTTIKKNNNILELFKSKKYFNNDEE